jgi:hypothetical protein
VISETKFFAIVFSGNPRWKRNRRSGLRLSHAAFSHLRKKRAARPEELVELREPARNILHSTMAREASISNCEREEALRKRERPGEPGL